MPYDLLVCDLDGTLLPAAAELHPELVAGFHRAAARGLLISLATGRMPPAVDRYRAELHLTAPLIYYNGALVRDTESGRDLLSLALPRGILAAAYRVFAHAPVHPLFYRDDQLYCLEKTFPIQAYCDQQGLVADIIPSPEEFLSMGSFMKSLFIGHPDALPLLREGLAPVAEPGARLVMTRRDYLEMVNSQASKGVALRYLAEHLGVPLSRVVAVGDEENDLEMIRLAGLGIAMPNAPPSVRAAADRVAPDGRDGGLLALLRQVMPERFA